MEILGISAFYHDAGACLIDDEHPDLIVAAAQEERFTREKHDPLFLVNAINNVLKWAGTLISELDAVIFYDKPFLKFDRLIETYYAFALKGVFQFIDSMMVWMKKKLFLKDNVCSKLKATEKRLLEEKFDEDKVRNVPILFTEHHLSPAASAFYPSPYERKYFVLGSE